MSTKVDFETACVMHYNGLELSRIEYFDSSKPTFFFQVRNFDYDAIMSEMKDGTTVILSAMVESIRQIRELLEKAKPSGVWNRK